jgi:fibronectin-binding autotransporter adhesin
MTTPATVHPYRSWKLVLGLAVALAGTWLRGQTVLTNGYTYIGPSILSGNYILNANTSATFQSGYTFQATTNLTLGNYATLNWNQNATLAGTAITSGSTAYAYFNVGSGYSLTLDPATSLTGYLNLSGGSGSTIINNGTITQNGGTSYGYISAATFTNNGTISATSGTNLTIGYYYYYTGTKNGSTGVITANGATVQLVNLLNQGQLNATNSGILEFEGGSNLISNLGNVALSSGGRALLQGTFDNTGTTLTAPSGGYYELYGGTINNGTIAANALIFTGNGGTIAGATLQAPVTLPASASVVLSSDALTGDINLGSYATLTLNNALSSNTAIPVGANVNLGSYATLNWNQNGTLTGNTLTFGSGTSYAYLNVGTNNSLTLGIGTLLTGDFNVGGSTGATLINNGAITLGSGSGYGYVSAPTFTNNGTITASGGTNLTLGNYYYTATTNSSTGIITANGATVQLSNLINQGGLSATNGGILEFEGPSNTIANLGIVVLSSGGQALLNGTFDNTGTTLTAPIGGTYELYGGTINNGTIAAGALTFSNYGGTIAGATLQDPVTLPASTSVTLSSDTLTGDINLGNYATLTLNNTLSSNTAIPAGSNVNLGNYATLNWNQNGTLTHNAITSGSTAGTYGYFQVGYNDALTLDVNTTLTGDVYLEGATGSTINNYGVITQNSGTGYLYAPTFNNYGTITANSSLNAGYYYYSGFTNEIGGTITASGSGTTVGLNNILNLGTLTATNSGILEFEGNTNLISNLGTVVLTGGGQALLNGTFDNTGTTLTAPTGGTYELYGGTINHGTIAASALTFSNYGGTIAGATLQGPVTLPASTSVTLSSDALTGDINLGASSTLTLNNTLSSNTSIPSGANVNLGNYATLNWNQVGTLTGNTITSGSTAGTYGYLQVGSNDTLTLDSATTLTGDVYLSGTTGSTINNYGTITQNSGTGYLYAPVFNNYHVITANSPLNVGYYYNTGFTNESGGIITANGSGTTVAMNNIVNLGTLNATNSGVLEFSGSTNLISNLGTVVLTSGGQAWLYGTFDNTGTMLTAPTGGTYELYGGTINHGTIATGALTFTNNGGTIAGATLQDPVTLPASTSVTLSSDTLTGDINLGNSSTLTLNNTLGSNTAIPTGANVNLGNYATLDWNQNGTLTGNTINSGATAGTYGELYVGYNDSLTLASTTTLTGDVYLYGYTGATITNNGAITQTSGNGTVYAPTFNNYGTITATANAGVTVGYYYSTGVTNESGGTITANGSNAIVHLENISNLGTLNAQNGGILEFEGLTNLVSNLGNVVLSNGGQALLYGTFDNTGTTLTAPTGGSYELYEGTITNGTIAAGALTFSNYGGTLSNVTYTGDLTLPASTYVTLTAGTTFTGSNLNLGNYSTLYWNQNGTLAGKTITSGTTAGNYAEISLGSSNTLTLGSTTTLTGDVYLYGYSGSSLSNQGTITQTAGTGYLYVPTFTNTGTLNVQGGTLYSAYTLNNTGGTITGAGNIQGNVTFAGGTIAPGNSGIGNLTFSYGTFAVTSSSVLDIEVSGATSDRVLFQSPTANVNIGSGLVALSLTLLSNPTPGTTYNIMTITSGSYTFSGTFAGLPASGDTFYASYGANPYQFTVNYLSSGVTLNFIAVPEPGTSALLGAGLALLGLRSFRRRRTSGPKA